MYTKSKHEDNGIKHKRSSYSTLNNSWEYSCPRTNINYSGFNGGINCLCNGMPMDRSSGDRAMISGQLWPIDSPQLGWRK